MTKLAPEWVRTSDPVIRSPARYRWTTAPATKYVLNKTSQRGMVIAFFIVYHIPRTQLVLPKLSGKKFKTFSIFDALDGFTQVELDEESSYYTTMYTPWVQLPYGVSSAPAEFQCRIHEVRLD